MERDAEHHPKSERPKSTSGAGLGRGTEHRPTGVPGWIDWELWEQVIQAQGITIERPRGSEHPVFPDILYPINYGFVNRTTSADGHEQDIFVGTASNGLVAAIFSVDVRRGDRECKLIYNCTPEEIYLVNGFINFNPQLMHGRLLMRHPMKALWRAR